MPDDVTLSVESYIDRLNHAHAELHGAHDKAHEREHHDQMVALEKAETGNKEWRSAANEWRGAMGDRESKFATVLAVDTISKRLDALEDANIKRVSEETQRVVSEAEEKRQDERRQGSAQWRIGIVVGVVSAGTAILVSIVMQLATAPP